MDYNQKEKLKNNISIIKSVFKWHEGITLTEQEIENLHTWCGWGFNKAVLFDPYNDNEWVEASEADKRLRATVLELHELLKEKLAPIGYTQTIESIKSSVLNSFYTPDVVVNTFMDVIKDYTNVQSIMDPSAGGGIFALSAMQHLPNLEKVTVYEKDMLTSKVLECIMEGVPGNVTVYNKWFEESDKREDSQYDMVATNPPYGNYPVYDPECKDKNISSKVHNYFVWKGLQKLKDGGILTYLISNAFLDTLTNKSARRYLFSNADFISLVVMPDNLMKESANTEAPSHFLVVRKKEGKTEADMSEEELLLCESQMWNLPDEAKGTVVSVIQNKYVRLHGEGCTIGDQKIGKNQYGKPAIETWWDGPIENISVPFEEILSRDMKLRWTTKVGDVHWKESKKIGEIKQIIVEDKDIEWEEVAPWDVSDGKECTPDIGGWKPGEQESFSMIGLTTTSMDEAPDTVEPGVIKYTITPDRITTDTPLKPGMLISVSEGRENLFEEKKELYKIETVSDNGTVTAVKVEVSKTEKEKLEGYAEIRDLYLALQKEEQQNQ